MGKEDLNESSAGWVLWTQQNIIHFESIYSDQYLELDSSTPAGDGIWSYVVVTLTGSPTQGGQATVYINGAPSGTVSNGSGLAGDDSAQTAYLGNISWSWPLEGLSDEFRISNKVRSSDWISTEYGNQSSPSTFYAISTENVAINPTSKILYGGQSQQFAATSLSTCDTSVNWSQTPAGLGTLTASGLYTAPTNIDTQQTVTVTATSVGDSTKWASATLTLMPPVAVSVTPSSVTLSDGGQPQQFAANVVNAINTAVTWTISPAGMGSVDATGLYTAPSGLTSQQTVTITATSQFDTTKAASATITLSPAVLPPPQCASNGYSYKRAIAIDHIRVPNSDQANFPFLFNTTDPAFATTANGGHITNFNGSDLIFTSDPAGQNVLDFELEEYNPVTGQVIAWVRIPTLSHTTDTVIYVFYGNTSITASRQNPAGVWDSNYMGVWHVANGAQLSLADSTSNGNSATNNGATATSGQIDGGMSTDGTTYATIGAPPSLANLPHGTATFSAWVNTATAGQGGAIMGKGNSNGFITSWALSTRQNIILFESMYSEGDIFLESSTPTGDGIWSYVVVALEGSPMLGRKATVYINGEPSGTVSYGGVLAGDDSAQMAYLGNAGWFSPLQGLSDEFRISNVARSPDWIATEYFNQSSPATFYQLNPENTQGVIPSTTLLYASQSAQFFDLSTCGTTAVNWSIPAGSPGTLTPDGLYTAPASIATQQPITVTASSTSDGTALGTATISLSPPISINLTPTSATLQADQSQQQQFTAVVSNTDNTDVLWSISPASEGTISSAGLYTVPSYVDRLDQPFTVTVTATVANSTLSASATIVVVPPLPVITVEVWPAATVLMANQTGQFGSSYVTQATGCSGIMCVTWSLSPGNLGSIDSYGRYTAPANIPTLETVTVIGSFSDRGVTATATATVTLLPNAPAIAVSPQTIALTGGQTSQYSASVSNAGSTAVTWTMSPSSAGILSASGLYTAPPVVTSQQVVTITSTSQAIPTLTASATLTLVPSDCAAKLYGYERSIVIDHTKVSDTDQPNFPFYFAVSDPLLATLANGGHMASSSGYDIQFSADPAGLKLLSYELEQYNPVTGQLVAWVKVPVLSHTQDTVIYMFYGNSAVTASQQPPAGAWDSNYSAVYQFDNVQPGFVGDSSANGNVAWGEGLQQATGEPGGAATFDGATSFIELPRNDFASFPGIGSSGVIYNSTFGVWFKTSTSGAILSQTDSMLPGGYSWGENPALYIDTKGYLRASTSDFQNAQQIVSFTPVNDNNWHYAVLSFNTDETTNDIGWYGGVSSTTSGLETVYLDGQVLDSQDGLIPYSNDPNTYISAYSYYLGTGNDNYSANGWSYFNGSLDQVEISSIARSGDWVRAEYPKSELSLHVLHSES